MKRMFQLGLVMVVALISARAQAQNPFDIQINFTGAAQFQAAFDSAEAIWESILPSRLASGTNDTLVINAAVVPDDGVGGTLGSAGPTSIDTAGGFTYSSSGIANFDSADAQNLVNNGSFEAVVLHEIGHVLGFGTLWDVGANNVYDDSTSGPTSVGQYTGAAALAVYNQEFSLNENFIPIENDGGLGTADGHFDEEFFGVALNSNSTVASGLRFGPNSGELLTGFLGSDIFISETTGGTFQDIGFEVDFDAIRAFNGDIAVVPEPTASAIVLACLAGLSIIRRRV